MFGMRATIEDDFDKVQKAADQATFRNVGHAAASIRIDAIESIHFTREIIGYRHFKSKSGKSVTKPMYRPSPPGTPPYGHKSKSYFRLGIRFDTTKDNAVIGPTKSKFGESMSAHEFGGQYKGANYPPRPFMHPALEREAPRFAASFAGSIEQ